MIFTFTFEGTYISTPPNIDSVFITVSELIIAWRKSHFTPPNTAVKSVPLNSSFSNFAFCSENVAQYEGISFWLLFILLISEFIFPWIESLKII